VITTTVAVSSVEAVTIISTTMITPSIVDATIVAGVTAIIPIIIGNAAIYIGARNGHIHSTSREKQGEKNKW